jgi:hypothetical protein
MAFPGRSTFELSSQVSIDIRFAHRAIGATRHSHLATPPCPEQVPRVGRKMQLPLTWCPAWSQPPADTGSGGLGSAGRSASCGTRGPVVVVPPFGHAPAVSRRILDTVAETVLPALHARQGTLLCATRQARRRRLGRPGRAGRTARQWRSRLPASNHRRVGKWSTTSRASSSSTRVSRPGRPRGGDPRSLGRAGDPPPSTPGQGRSCLTKQSIIVNTPSRARHSRRGSVAARSGGISTELVENWVAMSYAALMRALLTQRRWIDCCFVVASACRLG